MKKSFNILWIDDDQSSVKTDIQEIIDYLYEEEFIIPNVVYSNPTKWDIMEDFNINKADDSVKSILKDSELDLILMDYNLAEKPDQVGGKLISQIRNNENVFVPVIYYSQNNLEVLKQNLFTDDVQGVYTSDRKNVNFRAIQIIKSILAKEYKPRRLRSLLLTETSNLENGSIELFKQLWMHINKENQEIIVRKTKNYMLGSCSSKERTIKKNFLNVEDNFIDILFENNFCDASVKGYVFNKLFYYTPDLNFNDQTKDVKNCLEKLSVCVAEDSLFKYRNKFAHQTECKVKQNFTEELVKDIRKLLLEINTHQQNITNYITQRDS